MGRKNDSRAAVNPGKLLHRDGVAQSVQPRAAVFHGVGNAHQPHLSQMPDCLVGKLVVLVKQEGDWLDFIFRELSDFGTELFMRRGCLKQHGSSSFILLCFFCVYGKK